MKKKMLFYFYIIYFSIFLIIYITYKIMDEFVFLLNINKYKIIQIQIFGYYNKYVIINKIEIPLIKNISR